MRCAAMRCTNECLGGRRVHGRSNATARETTKYRHSRVLTRDTGHFYSQLRQRIIGTGRTRPTQPTQVS
jgi:hypothetical protein